MYDIRRKVSGMRRYLTYGIIIVAIVALVSVFIDNVVGKTVSPKLQLQTFAGEKVTIGGSANKPVFINFWASWCGPCKEETPTLVKLEEKYGKQIKFIGINATSVDTRQDAYEFVLKHQMKYTVVLDKNGTAADKYKVAGFPTSFLLDKKGNIVATFNGAYSYAEFEKQLNNYLNK
jgi:thiol-disulfide isomerase/thioredoxin